MMRRLAPCLAIAWLLSASTAGAFTLQYERRTLSNGAVLIVSEQRNVPMVVVRFLIDAGSRRDPAGKEGLANLTADLLTEGTRKRTASQISDAVDSIGASLNSGAGVDAAHLNLTVLTKDLATGLDLAADVLLNPAFSESELDRRREAVLAAMKASEDQPGYVAMRDFTEFLFRDEPYGHIATGTPAGVKAITRKNIVEFYETNYRPERTIITIVGDISADEASRSMEDALGRWKRGSAADFDYPPLEQRAAEVLKISRPVTQANVILGHRGIARSDPDYYAIEVMNFVLGGGGFGSRLLDNIRTKAGLAYSVASGFSAPKAPGSFRIVLQTKNESASDAVKMACAEIDRMRREPITDEELGDAKLYLTGSFPLLLDSNSEIASFLTDVEFFQLGADYAETYAKKINAVTKEDVLRVAREHITPEKLSLVIVANFDQAKVADTPPCVGELSP